MNGPSAEPGAPVYLDYAATTPVDARVRASMAPFLDEQFGNAASRDHVFGWNAAEAIDEARAHVAALVGVRAANVVFTSGATESVNAAFKGLAWCRDARAHAVMSGVEHNAVVAVCQQLQRIAGWRIDTLPVDRNGHLELDDLSNRLEAAPDAVVSVMWANNEIGTLYPVAGVADLVHEHANAMIFSDVTHAVGRVPVDLGASGVDIAALSSHKVYGPKGVGALILRGRANELPLEPLIAGGGQERGRRSGTADVAGIVGFGEACRIASLEMAEDARRLAPLRDAFERALTSTIEGCWVNGGNAPRVTSTSSLGLAGIDATTLVRQMHRVAVSTRAACSSGSREASRVLRAIGLTDADARSCVRVSLGRYTTADEIEHAIDHVVGTVRRLRRSAGVPS
jgi:cysteine desulfurase